MTRARDALDTKRRELPMVKTDQDYVFEGPEGNVSVLGQQRTRPPRARDWARE